MKSTFTQSIFVILTAHFGSASQTVFESSPLLQYLNIKTRSANRGSKARGAFANHYALYVLTEDYVQKGFSTHRAGEYHQYEGARFSDLLRRQRSLPFGAKLQNHALNARLNDEFAKYFPILNIRPILRDVQNQRYWINEQLLLVSFQQDSQPVTVNIAAVVLEIIDDYVRTKQAAFEAFMLASRQLAVLPTIDMNASVEFIKQQLQPFVDARIFEIVSYAILKSYYGGISIFWGWNEREIQQDVLTLYKTGRTNANDGGIDFVMKPLGRFFQVTETLDVAKYFLDIDKIQRYPLTFVVKSTEATEMIRNKLRQQAQLRFGIDAIVDQYMDAIEEIINVNMLLERFEQAVSTGHLQDIMNDIVQQSQLEFNYPQPN